MSLGVMIIYISNFKLHLILFIILVELKMNIFLLAFYWTFYKTFYWTHIDLSNNFPLSQWPSSNGNVKFDTFCNMHPYSFQTSIWYVIFSAFLNHSIFLFHWEQMQTKMTLKLWNYQIHLGIHLQIMGFRNCWVSCKDRVISFPASPLVLDPGLNREKENFWATTL